MRDSGELLATEADIRAFAAVARAEGQLALDTEFVWEKTYAPVPCLIQVATRERVALLDPIEGAAIEPIAELVADRAVEIVMHAPSADLLLFALRYDSLATNVFDTQTVGGFIGYGSSLAYDRMVERSTGTKLEHNETFSVWSRRPLTETQLAYAADDVRYLLPAADAMRDALSKTGRTSWAADELERRFGNPEAIVAAPERAYLKVSRRGRLTGRQLSCLRAVAAWRETEARRRDLPKEWVLKDASLIEVARQAPRDAEAIGKLRGLGSINGASLDALVAAVEAGVTGEPIAPAKDLPPGLARRINAAAALGTVLARVRCEAANIAPEVGASRSDIEAYTEAVVRDAVTDESLGSGWRHELLGAELRELIEGRVALVPMPEAPYVRTFPLQPTE